MDYVIGAVVLVGALLVLLAATGLHRFSTVMSRLHVSGKASTLGVLLVLMGGVALPSPAAPRLALAALLYVLTVAAAMNLLGRVIQERTGKR